DEPGFGAALDAVKAGIAHHVGEEEGEVFPALRRSESMLAEMARPFLAKRLALGLPMEPEALAAAAPKAELLDGARRGGTGGGGRPRRRQGGHRPPRGGGGGGGVSGPAPIGVDAGRDGPALPGQASGAGPSDGTRGPGRGDHEGRAARRGAAGGNRRCVVDE